jgi:predicted nucleotidyltransferase component of viral defense system
MDKQLRTAQMAVLRIFAKHALGFALAGGTALEVYYLQHRFSRDLDFFSPQYSDKEIEAILAAIRKEYGQTPILKNEFRAPQRARVKFYSLKANGTSRPLKLDFVEDNLTAKPEINKVQGVPVYSAKQIYFQKLIAVGGGRIEADDIGRETLGGRNEARDVVDLYYLSRKIELLHDFLKQTPRIQQRGIVHWYRRFSRQEFKLAFLDLEIYDRKLSSTEVIRHLEQEVKTFMEGELS